MKTILVLTDFSAHAKHGATYALQLAKKLKADLLLCNTYLVPAEVAMSGLSVWPQQEYAILSEDSSTELNLLKKYLQNQEDMQQDASGFRRNITINSADGNISDIINGLGSGTDICLVVAGTHDKTGLDDFLLGNNVNKIIDNINFPLLLVPPAAVDKPIKKIAFATDLVFLENDEKAFYQLVGFARTLNAEILVTHIFNESNNKADSEKRIKELLTQISNKADYPNIYYRIVNEKVPEKGLTWLCGHGQVDVLAMVHQKHSFLEHIFVSSHTQKMAKRIGIPLLVLPTHP